MHRLSPVVICLGVFLLAVTSLTTVTGASALGGLGNVTISRTTPSAPAPARRAPQTRINLSKYSPKTSQGSYAYFSGRVRPFKSTKLLLQVKYPQRGWKTIKRSRSNQRGAFSFSDSLSTGRNRFYRVRTTVKRGPRAARTRAVKVSVRSVQDLVDLVSTGAGLVPTDGIQIPSYHHENGGTQLISDPSVNQGHIAFALKGRCNVLRLAPGSAYESAAGSSVDVTLRLDGKVAYSDTFAPGQGPYALRLQVFNVRKVKRIRFSYTSTNPSVGPSAPNGVYVGFALAKVGCLPGLPKR